jgi:adenosine deaminase
MMKVDTHRHLGGSCPVSFVWDAIKKLGLTHLAESEAEVRSQMTFLPGESGGFHRFLDKFKILDEIPWTPELIGNSIKAVCDELATEGTDYALMDFSINKYMKIGWHKREAIEFIHGMFEKYRPGGVGLVLSLKYESMRASQRQYAKLIEHPDVAGRLVGLDLVGDETYFDADFYAPLFEDWHKAKKRTRAHVGESQSRHNVAKTVKKLKATNIAHGYKVMEDPEMVRMLLDYDVTFDGALTSTYLTMVWEDPTTHPLIDMHRAGLRVTLGSDDPVQCSTTLDGEFALARKLGLTESEELAIRRNALLAIR